MQYLLFLSNVHAVVQFPANMPPTKTHAKTPMKTQVPPIQPKSNKNPDLDSNAEEESTTKRVTWDNSRDGLLIELLLVGLQQGKKSDSGFKINVFNDAAKQFNIRFKVTPKFKGSQLQTCYYTVFILRYFSNTDCSCISIIKLFTQLLNRADLVGMI